MSVLKNCWTALREGAKVVRQKYDEECIKEAIASGEMDVYPPPMPPDWSDNLPKLSAPLDSDKGEMITVTVNSDGKIVDSDDLFKFKSSKVIEI